MYHGFPASMIALLSCPYGCGPLRLGEHAGNEKYISHGVLDCSGDGHNFSITDGVVRLLDLTTLDRESNNERLRRDEGARALDTSWEKTAYNQSELQTTIDESEPLQGAIVLELGAGTGRYTEPMAERGASILAVDMSGESLRSLASRVGESWNIGLVQADCTKMMVQPQRFDLIASTLMSNIPTQPQRLQVMEVAAKAVKPGGKFVFGTHYYGFGSWIRGERKSGYYREAPIYRYMYRRGEIKRETRRYFAQVSCHPVRISFPLAGRLGDYWVPISRKLERVPVINQFGDLLLVVAQNPLISAELPATH